MLSLIPAKCITLLVAQCNFWVIKVSTLLGCICVSLRINDLRLNGKIDNWTEAKGYWVS